MSFPEALSKHLGVELIETVADRRGSVVLKVRRGKDLLALKGVDPDVTDTYDRSELLEFEAKLLKSLSSLAGDQFVDTGRSAELGPWLLMRWVDGESASAISRHLRAGGGGWGNLFAPILRAYARIHEAGYLHGDVQPKHCLLENERDAATILDWGLGRKIDGTNPAFKGSFVHYAAPEVAESMLANDANVPYGLSAEIYSIGAMMYFCLTGTTAVDYGPGDLKDIPLDTKLQAVAAGNLRGFSGRTPLGSAALQTIVMQSLAKDPASRASVGELARAVDGLQ